MSLNGDNGDCGGIGSTRSNGETEFIDREEILRFSVARCESVLSALSVTYPWGTIAIARSGAPLPPPIFMGSAIT
jgi:hypothetical protein